MTSTSLASNCTTVPHPPCPQIQDKCIVCPAHGTAFDMETGEVVGKWCPSLPEALSTGFGLTPKKPLSVLQARVNEAGEIEVNL